MSNKFFSILSAIGKAFEKGLEFILPFANAASPFVAIAAPGIGVLYNTVLGVVSQTEQKFAAMGKQNGTGPQKLAEVLQIVGPVVESYLQTTDKEVVTNYVNAVVAILNAIPATAAPQLPQG